MSLITEISLLFGAGKQIGGIKIDAFVKESHTMSATKSSHPTEIGTSISDNVVMDPEELEIEGVVGPTSIYLKDILTYSFSRIHDVDTQLVNLMSAKTPITIVTGLRIYDNMVITSYEVGREAGGGKGLEFTMNLERATRVQAQFADGSKAAIAPKAAKQATPKSTKGTQAATDSSDVAAEESHMIPDAENMLRKL